MSYSSSLGYSGFPGKKSNAHESSLKQLRSYHSEAKRRAMSYSPESTANSSLNNMVQTQLSSKIYTALTSLLHSSISLAKVEQLEQYILTKAVGLPKGVFDMAEWRDIIDCARKCRMKEFSRLKPSSGSFNPSIELDLDGMSFGNSRIIGGASGGIASSSGVIDGGSSSEVVGGINGVITGGMGSKVFDVRRDSGLEMNHSLWTGGGGGGDTAPMSPSQDGLFSPLTTGILTGPGQQQQQSRFSPSSGGGGDVIGFFSSGGGKDPASGDVCGMCERLHSENAKLRNILQFVADSENVGNDNNSSEMKKRSFLSDLQQFDSEMSVLCELVFESMQKSSDTIDILKLDIRDQSKELAVLHKRAGVLRSELDDEVINRELIQKRLDTFVETSKDSSVLDDKNSELLAARIAQGEEAMRVRTLSTELQNSNNASQEKDEKIKSLEEAAVTAAKAKIEDDKISIIFKDRLRITQTNLTKKENEISSLNERLREAEDRITELEASSSSNNNQNENNQNENALSKVLQISSSAPLSDSAGLTASAAAASAASAELSTELDKSKNQIRTMQDQIVNLKQKISKAVDERGAAVAKAAASDSTSIVIEQRAKEAELKLVNYLSAAAVTTNVVKEPIPPPQSPVEVPALLLGLGLGQGLVATPLRKAVLEPLTPRSSQKVVKLQSQVRGFLGKKSMDRHRTKIAARETGVLVALKNTKQGESGWYESPDGKVYYFICKKERWEIACGPLSIDQFDSLKLKQKECSHSVMRKEGFMSTSIDYKGSLPKSLHESKPFLIASNKNQRLFMAISLDSLSA